LSPSLLLVIPASIPPLIGGELLLVHVLRLAPLLPDCSNGSMGFKLLDRSKQM